MYSGYRPYMVYNACTALFIRNGAYKRHMIESRLQQSIIDDSNAPLEGLSKQTSKYIPDKDADINLTRV
jgi:hypothetical protein